MIAQRRLDELSAGLRKGRRTRAHIVFCRCTCPPGLGSFTQLLTWDTIINFGRGLQVSIDGVANRKSTPSIFSAARIVLLSFVSSFFVLVVSLILQWAVYDDWLHHTGPLRLIGSLVAAVLTFLFVLRWQYFLRERHLEMLRRFETIARMNDRIRNALQIIECTAFLSNPEAANHVGQAVDMIDGVLQEVFADVHSPATTSVHQKKRATDSNTEHAKRTSA